jgi:hypothetical protein
LELAPRTLIVLLALAAGCRSERARASGEVVPGAGAAAPRVTVAVLNASGRSGLARLGTRVLRDAGIDVLSFGNRNEGKTTLDSTRTRLCYSTPACSSARIFRPVSRSTRN